jgi:2'-5' RNA ligase
MTATLAIPLDAAHVDAVQHLRRRLGIGLDAKPVLPHVSLLVISDFEDLRGVRAGVHAVAERFAPFAIRAGDIGIFLDGDGTPVLHVPVARSSLLSRLHRSAYDAATDRGAAVDGHSRPDFWMPHITIWSGDTTPEALGRAIAEYAAGPPISWSVPASALAWLDETGVLHAEPLGMAPCHR